MVDSVTVALAKQTFTMGNTRNSLVVEKNLLAIADWDVFISPDGYKSSLILKSQVNTILMAT